MGFDSDLFNGEIDEEFKCSICCDVIEDPAQVVSCEHVFCRQCITKWIEREASCPVCRISIKKVKSGLAPISRFMRNKYCKLQMKCSFAKCTHVCFLEDMAKHEYNCPIGPGPGTRQSIVTYPVGSDSLNVKRIDKTRSKEFQIKRTSLDDKTQKEVIKIIKEAIYLYGHVNFSQIAAYVKTNIEPENVPLWHCIVGDSFDCWVTTEAAYISVLFDGIHLMAFKTK